MLGYQSGASLFDDRYVTRQSSPDDIKCQTLSLVPTNQPNGGTGKLYYDASLGFPRFFASQRWVSMQQPISLRDFGAKGDNLTDDTVAMRLWWAAVIQRAGASGFIPKGSYRLTEQFVFDLSNVTSSGVVIFGEGCQQSMINNTFQGDYPFIIGMRDGLPSSMTGAFYGSFSRFGLQTHRNGIGTVIGYPDYRDALNSMVFSEMVFGNGGNPGANNNSYNGTVALRITNCFAGLFNNVTVNCAGETTTGTTTVILDQTQFTTFNGCSFGNGYTVLVLTGGCSGNAFNAIDLEASAGVCLAINSETTTRNTFIGGTFVCAQYPVNATAGSDNVLINTILAGGQNLSSNFQNDVGIVYQRGGVYTGSAAFEFKQSLTLSDIAPSLANAKTVGTLQKPFKTLYAQNLVLPIQDNEPQNPQPGQIYFDGTRFRGYTGSAWTNLN